MAGSKALLALAVLALAGCARPLVVYECPALPIPEPAPLPTIAPEQFIERDGLICFDERAYEDLAVRDAMRRGHAEELRAIIRAHNESVEEK